MLFFSAAVQMECDKQVNFETTKRMEETNDYEERPSMITEDDNQDNEQEHKSMTMEEASDRLIDPENVVIGGKSSANMYEFVPSQETTGLAGFVEEPHYFNKYGAQSSGMPFSIVGEELYQYPTNLNAFIFPFGEFDHFAQPKRLYDGPFNYFCLDAASLLPVLMLDLQTGDQLLDMCSSPGGKALAALQTLKPTRVVCNDAQAGRLRKVTQTMTAYHCEKFNDEMKTNIIQYSCRDGIACPNVFGEQFDKVLCDVPCFTDRHALFEDSNNIFKSHRSKERIKLPELQSSLLTAAIQCLKPGGSVVYSTCSLSPMQNDGAVSLALKKIWEETEIEVVVCDLSKTVMPYKKAFRFSQNMKVTRFGQQVVPCIGNNFGPMYFAKIKRLN